MRIQAQFEVTGWDESAYDEVDGEAKLSRATVTKEFSGALEGRSTAAVLMAGLVEGSAGYVASEKVDGALDGRKGTFVLQHGATMSPEGPVFFGHVVPGTGTGELRGLRGTVKVEHGLLTMDYDVD
ncbi:hypothetical protein Lesp02_79330 [Lentzea sp. NBRC 105346]|uniref:DUF3224 domain-containing protein n=1 Tax=Lentzea sp. NBRC 105346 TaxID=3032205 RepID=UPI0024A5E972|nr:DUF3224 domain-containing protein [Lentzea sp. NBRC 105346]GLZ35746.1 hypothetical protein Lesp02_79330 [Lentzea sp. NBRC 105346]